MHRVGIGAISGFIATGVMDLFLTGVRRLGVLHTYPPEEITGRALEAADVRHDEGERKAATAVAHHAFGATAGAAFGLVPMPRKQSAVTVTGILYALGIWLVSYAGWIPKLGLRPPPSDDPPESQASIAAGHAVYGAALGALLSLT
jgi:uncharacterized membrane protein YagU involved in acid resistance